MDLIISRTSYYTAGNMIKVVSQYITKYLSILIKNNLTFMKIRRKNVKFRKELELKIFP